MAIQRLDRVKIEGFRSIAKLDLRLRPLNVLIGQNGAGKSNFIGLFNLVRQVVTGNLQLYTSQRGGANRILHYGRKRTERLYVELRFPPNGYELSLVPTDEDTFTFGYEGGQFNTGDHNDHPYFESLTPPGAFESKLAKPSTRPKSPVAKHVYQALQSWRVYHFHDTSRDASVKQSSPLGIKVLQEDGSNLAAFLWRMQQDDPKYYRRLVRTIQLIIPFFQDFYFEGEYDSQKSIRLQWQDQENPDMVFNAHALSDGSIRFICIATLLLQPELPSVILLDEPELGLHPSAIALLAELLSSASHRATVIVSTQSVNLVSAFEPNDIIVVDRDAQGASTFIRQEAAALAEWLERYSLGELWEKNILGGKP